MEFNVSGFDVDHYNAIVDRGLSAGIGSRDSQMCIEAAICAVLNLPHGDDPLCVTAAVRLFKISLNDKRWSSPKARAEGLRKLGLAQLGSLGVVNSVDFTKSLSDKMIRVMLPKLLRKLYQDKPEILQLADRCEKEGTIQAAKDTADADADADADAYADARDEWLTLAANFALDVLIELKSPGCALLE